MGCSKPRFPKIPKTGFNSDHTILYFLCYEGYLLFKQLPYFIHQERHIHTKKNVSRSNAQRKTTYIVTLIKLRRKQSIRSRLPYSKTHRHDSEPWLTPIGRAAPSSLTTVWICQRQRCILQSTSDFSQLIYSALTSEWPVSTQDFGLAQSSQHWSAKTQSWVSILHIIKSSWLQFPWGLKHTHTHTHTYTHTHTHTQRELK